MRIQFVFQWSLGTRLSKPHCMVNKEHILNKWLPSVWLPLYNNLGLLFNKVCSSHHTVFNNFISPEWIITVGNRLFTD